MNIKEAEREVLDKFHKELLWEDLRRSGASRIEFVLQKGSGYDCSVVYPDQEYTKTVVIVDKEVMVINAFFYEKLWGHSETIVQLTDIENERCIYGFYSQAIASASVKTIPEGSDHLDNFRVYTCPACNLPVRVSMASNGHRSINCKGGHGWIE